jgi:hypothetical protein
LTHDIWSPSAGWLTAPHYPGAAPAGAARAGKELSTTADSRKETPEQFAFFEKHIRPVLVKECYSCHATTAKKVRGGLTLDTRAGIRKGGDIGPAVVPGDARNSLILAALRHARAELEMPLRDLREQGRNITGQNAFIRRIFLQARSATLRSQLNFYDSDGTPRPLAMGVREGRFASDSRVYNRGELDQPGETVKRGFPRVLTTKQPAIERGSGRRELAEWIASASGRAPRP